jgi:TrmH family RNA methyltransferase
VRASAGSVFRIPLIAANAEEGLARLRAAGVTIWTTAVQGAEPAHEADLAGPVALLIGNEGNGVAEDVAAEADGAVTIPCPGPVESLNAAVAASVLLYEASRQRAEPSIDPSRPSQKARRMGHPNSKAGQTDYLTGGRR